MNISTLNDVLDILRMPFDEFNETVKLQAKEIHRKYNADTVLVTALLGYDNICKNQCLYCGMRAGQTGLKRFRLTIDEIKRTIDTARELGLQRIFMISGEDPGVDFQDILEMVGYAKQEGFTVSLGAGEFNDDEYGELEATGLDEYVLKFETSDKAMFDRIKPSTTFENRMRCIETIRNSNMKLASGNIIGLPHQPLEQIADDIMLMKELKISWAPIIPYMPVPGTPLAEEGGRGSLELLLKEIAVLRILMPKVNITAQQPGDDPAKGLADEQGNLNALAAGANHLFIDMLPAELVNNFSVINNRIITGIDNLNSLIASAGMTLTMR